jgi:hypothetical protein
MKISKTFILLGVCLFIFNSSAAQEELDQLVTQQFVNLLPLSYNIELPVGGRETFVIESGLDLAFLQNFPLVQAAVLLQVILLSLLF